MKKILAVLIAILMLSACGKEPAPEAPVTEPENNSVSEPASEPEEAPSEEPEKETSEEEKENEPASEPEEKIPFDAKNVLIEETSDGIKVSFEVLPETAEDMQAIVDEHGIDDPLKVTAYFIAAVSRYNEAENDAFAMIDVLRGPQPMSDGDKSFMKERFSDKLYLPDAYFEGAKPANDYKTEAPYVIMVYDVVTEAPEGYAYGEVMTAGAENPRRITLREKDGNFYIWEYNGILLSIKLPASEDPWA